MPRRKILGLLIWVLPFIIACFTQLFGKLENFENILIDFRYNYLNPNHKISDKVIVVTIDNDSLMNFAHHPDFGRWPWKRNVYLPILRFIAKQNPRMIFFDLLFTEPSKEDDKIVRFHKEFSRISHTLFLQKTENKKLLTKDEFNLDKFTVKVKEEKSNCNNEFQIAIPPTNKIGKTAPFLHALGDREFGERLNKDDILVYKYDNKYFPSLPIVALNSFEPIHSLNLSPSELSIKASHKIINIPLSKCYFSFHYYSKKEIKNISLVAFYRFNPLYYKKDKLDSRFGEVFRDKIVLIGATATSIFDEKITPYGNLPSVILNATAISNLLNEHFLTPIPIWISIFLSIIFCFLGFYLSFFLKGIIKRTFLPFIILFTYTIFCLYAFKIDYLFNLSFFLVSYPVSYFICLGYISFLEGMENLKLLEETIELNRKLTIFNENL